MLMSCAWSRSPPLPPPPITSCVAKSSNENRGEAVNKMRVTHLHRRSLRRRRVVDELVHLLHDLLVLLVLGPLHPHKSSAAVSAGAIRKRFGARTHRRLLDCLNRSRNTRPVLHSGTAARNTKSEFVRESFKADLSRRWQTAGTAPNRSRLDRSVAAAT